MDRTPEPPNSCEAYVRCLRAAAEAGLTAAELEELLDLRVGPEPRKHLRELLEEREEIVLAQIRLRGRLSPSSASRKVRLAGSSFRYVT